MVVRVKEYPEFLTSIYNYIIEEYEIGPRDFEMATNIKNEVESVIETDGGKGLKYVPKMGVVPFQCYDYKRNRRALHTHRTIESNRDLLFCSEPEIAALVYINRSVYGGSKYRLIGTMKRWLPTVTMNDVEVAFDDNEVHSDLYPSYSIHFLRQNQTPFANLTYVYHDTSRSSSDDDFTDGNIVIDEDEYTLTGDNKTIMVRRRSRSRSRSKSRSRSPSVGRRAARSGRGTKRRRRSRSRSPAASGGVPRPNNRQRSRSRSRSRSRTR